MGLCGDRIMPKIIIECKGWGIVEILRRRIAREIEDVEITLNLPVGAIKFEVIE